MDVDCETYKSSTLSKIISELSKSIGLKCQLWFILGHETLNEDIIIIQDIMANLSKDNPYNIWDIVLELDDYQDIIQHNEIFEK